MEFAREAAVEMNPVTSWRGMARSSPGKLFIITLLLVILSISTGFYGAQTIDDRAATLNTMINDTEPAAEAAQVLYSSLSIADATANSAFISGGVESPELRSRYLDSMATASQALVRTAGGASSENDQSRADLATLGQQIPVYTGIVETARTNNRVGNPVGSSYLGEASHLMQQTILPAAERLYSSRSMAISDPQNSFTAPPWGTYTLLALLLLALVATQMYLARRSNRTFNLGLLLATGLAIVATVWLLVAGIWSVAATTSAENTGATPLRALTKARILTQQARSDETLGLVRRGDQRDLENSYGQAVEDIDTQLRSTLDTDDSQAASDTLKRARAQLNAWGQAHARLVAASTAGDYNRATSIAVGDNPADSTAQYQALDRTLVDGITSSRDTFRNGVDTAKVALGFAGTGLTVLGILAAIAVIGGFIPRVREYR